MMDLNDEQYHRLQHAIAVTRESLAIAAELGDDPAQWEGVVSRNAPCPCGSGRKYKHCHGAVTA